jgi:predicted Ser/Thr protein kinase
LKLACFWCSSVRWLGTSRGSLRRRIRHTLSVPIVSPQVPNDTSICKLYDIIVDIDGISAAFHNAVQRYSTAVMAKVHDIKLLQASTDPDDISEFRLLVDDQHIKYVTVDPYIFDAIDLVFEPTLIDILQPLLPAGEWNHARIFQATSPGKSSNGNIEIQVEPSIQMLNGIREILHSLQIDYLEMDVSSRLRSNVYEAKSSKFPGQFVVKFARFDYEITRLEHETVAYKWIDGHSIGPRFLGHVTEHGRVIGFAMSKIENARHATLDDLDICRQALRRLHALGIKHGDTNKHNFLIHSQGVTLIDFDFANQNATEAELNKELLGLEQEFADASGKGGVGDLIDGI